MHKNLSKGVNLVGATFSHKGQLLVVVKFHGLRRVFNTTLERFVKTGTILYAGFEGFLSTDDRQQLEIDLKKKFNRDGTVNNNRRGLLYSTRNNKND